MIYLKKRKKSGFLTIWLIIHRLFLDVYVPLSFATIVDMHIRANRSANPSASLETTTNNSKPFRQGLWSHLLHQLILVGAAAYWQLSHLLPANVRDALAGHDELQDVQAHSRALMLDLQLQPSTVEHHLAHPSLSGAQKLLWAVKLVATSCHKVSSTSQTWQQNQ